MSEQVDFVQAQVLDGLVKAVETQKKEKKREKKYKAKQKQKRS